MNDINGWDLISYFIPRPFAGVFWEWAVGENYKKYTLPNDLIQAFNRKHGRKLMILPTGLIHEDVPKMIKLWIDEISKYSMGKVISSYHGNVEFPSEVYDLIMCDEGMIALCKTGFYFAEREDNKYLKVKKWESQYEKECQGSKKSRKSDEGVQRRETSQRKQKGSRSNKSKASYSHST